jgi:hypothetical protein
MLHKAGAAQGCVARTAGYNSTSRLIRQCVTPLNTRWGDLAGVPLCVSAVRACVTWKLVLADLGEAAGE